MESKKTRVEITSELNEILNEYINQQKANGLKGLSKIKVLEQLCKSGLAFQKQSELTGANSNTATLMGVKQPTNPHPNEYVIETKSELKAMQEALYEKEKRLFELEKFLLDKENIIDNKHSKVIKIYEKNLKAQPDPYKSITDQMKLDSKFEKIERGNDYIRDDISSMKKDLIKVLREIKNNSEGNVFFDKVLPVLATLGVGVNTYQNFNKNKSSQDAPEITKVFENFSKLNKEEQQKLIKDIQEIANPPTKQTSPRK